MLQTAFGEFGIDNVTAETSWLDLLPPDPPATLAPFYGAPSSYSIAFPSDIDLTGVVFDPARRAIKLVEPELAHPGRPKRARAGQAAAGRAQAALAKRRE